MSKFHNAVGFLQNAWSPAYVGKAYPRKRWVYDLSRSCTGRGLKVLQTKCANLHFYFANTTPIAGETPSSIIPPKPAYMRRVISDHKPDVIVTFGKQAEKAMRTIGVNGTPWLIVPHPTCRVVTNKLYKEAGKLLARGFKGTIKLSQLPGKIAICELPRS